MNDPDRYLVGVDWGGIDEEVYLACFSRFESSAQPLLTTVTPRRPRRQLEELQQALYSERASVPDRISAWRLYERSLVRAAQDADARRFSRISVGSSRPRARRN